MRTSEDQYGEYLADVGAMLKCERFKLCKAVAEARKAEWWQDRGAIRTLAVALIDQCVDRDEMRRVVAEVLEKPWNWRVEFVIAKCREMDSGHD